MMPLIKHPANIFLVLCLFSALFFMLTIAFSFAEYYWCAAATWSLFVCSIGATAFFGLEGLTKGDKH